MGGWGSGSQKRSFISTTAEAYRLAISDLRHHECFGQISDLLSSTGTRAELEICSAEPGSYEVRVWSGSSTGYGFGISENEVDRRLWLSPDSLFIRMVGTRPNYGGIRVWFVCPKSDCGRKCAVLYRQWDTSSRAFACRRCARIVYESQRMSRLDRLEAKAERLTSRLISVDTDGLTYMKPKWMRWATFAKIASSLEQVDKEWAPAAMRQMQPFITAMNDLESRTACNDLS
jgi:hypothetical protein